jgi:hypothetical protein
MTTRTALPVEATSLISLAIYEAESIEDVTAMGLELQSLIKQAREKYAMLKNNGSPVATPEQTQPVGEALAIRDGIYTVAFEDGKHVTLKFKTQDATATFMPGKQLVSYLNGSDNWENYKTFGTLAYGRLHVFRKYSGQLARQQGAVSRLLKGNDAQLAGLKSYGMASGKCGICSRRLTTPESIERGIGPECAAKMGM